MKKNPMYVVKSVSMSTYLMQQGFKLELIEKNRDNPNNNVFIFGDSPQLREAVTYYTHKLSYKRNGNKQTS